MSAYSTLNITETKAKLMMLESLLGRDPDWMELEAFMDDQLKDLLYNCRVVPDDEPNDDDAI